MPVNKIHGTLLTAISKVNGIAKANIRYFNGKIITVITVPEGLIIPFNSDAAVPAGWTAYTDADEKYIIGAGDTYAVDATAASQGQKTLTSSAAGGHTGDSDSFVPESGTGPGTGAEDNHTHTLSYTWVPPYQNSRLIRADADTTILPQNGVSFRITEPEAGLDNIWTDDYMFFASAGAIGTGGTNSIAGLTSSAEGDHSHGSDAGGQPSAGKITEYKGQASGGHTHSSTVTITNTLRQYALSAWENASADYDMESGMIAMYESLTPPDGWYLCDGDNGTPDLQNYFIVPTTSGSEGASGDGTITSSGSGFGHALHNHEDGEDATCSGSEGAYHSNNVRMSAHTLGSNYIWLPAYYALAFIMKE